MVFIKKARLKLPFKNTAMVGALLLKGDNRIGTNLAHSNACSL